MPAFCVILRLVVPLMATPSRSRRTMIPWVGYSIPFNPPSVAESPAFQWVIPSSIVPRSSWLVGGSVTSTTSAKLYHWPSTDWGEWGSYDIATVSVVRPVSACTSIYIVNASRTITVRLETSLASNLCPPVRDATPPSLIHVQRAKIEGNGPITQGWFGDDLSGGRISTAPFRVGPLYPRHRGFAPDLS